MNIEERLERLETFIGDVDAIRLYANSLQEVLDRYIAPLYIEQGSENVMLINDYLGDLENIPHNIIFKIRASHDLTMIQRTQAIIRFQRGTEYKEYTLRKMVNKHLVPLEDGNYTDGEVYDVYINSQDVAVITANDTGVRALSEVAALTAVMNTNFENVNKTISDNYNTLNTKTDETLVNAKAYTDMAAKISGDAIANINTFLNGISKNGNTYTFSSNIIAPYIETPNFKGTKTLDVSGANGFQLPSGTTIADPSSNLALTNQQWVNLRIKNEIDSYHAEKHITGTQDANTALSGKDNGTFYYKLSQ